MTAITLMLFGFAILLLDMLSNLGVGRLFTSDASIGFGLLGTLFIGAGVALEILDK